MTDPAKIAIRASTQEHLEIEDIKDDLVILKDGSSCLVLATTAINFWLSGSRGRSLIYDPTIVGTDIDNTTAESSASLSAEIILDFVGTFVGYKTQVAKGKIEVLQISGRKGAQGQECISSKENGNMTLQVENLSLPPFSTTDGEYFLTLDCRPEITGITAIAAFVSPETNRVRLDSIPPGEKSGPIVFDLFAEGADTKYALPADQLFCWANLTSASSSLALYIDVVKIDCGINPNFTNPYNSVISPNTTTPPETPSTCKNCMDHKCWVEKGELHKSCVFWIIVLVLSIIVLALLVSVIYLVTFYVKQRTRISESDTLFKRWKRKNQNE